MNKYEVKKVYIKDVNNVTDYWKRINSTWPHYCNGLKEVEEYCGGKLKRGRAGYSAIIGNYECLAIKTQ